MMSAIAIPSVFRGMPDQDTRATDAQIAVRLLDAMSWIANNAHCIATRRFVYRVLREVEAERPDLRAKT